MDKKKMLIGGLALIAVIGAYVWYSNKNKKITTTTTNTTPAVNPLEGKIISTGDSNGYNGGAVYSVKNGKKVLLTPTEFQTYVDSNGYDKIVIITQDKLDALKDA